MKGAAAVFFGLIVLAGCVSAPFPEPAPVSLEDAKPESLIEGFQRGMPESFQLLNTIVFEYNFVTFPGLGFVAVDKKEGTYKVACMNQMGVKFLEFEGNRDGLTRQYIIEPLAKRGNVAQAVGTDIRRIYFDLLPRPDARIIRRKTELVFRQRSGDGALEYAFGGKDGLLLKKTYREDHRAVWRVSYYEYTEKDGKLFPLGIIFSNYRYGYRLIVRQKEIRS